MPIRLLISLMVLVGSWGFANPGALAKPGSGKEKTQSEISEILADRTLDKTVRFVINNSLFTLYHEVGHLLVDKQQWPVLGREEDVADNFATYILLTQRRRAFEQALKDAALGWRLEGEARGARTAGDFYGEHSLDLQRAYQIVCMMVGEDRRTFSVTASEWGIDRRRQSGCRDDYEQISRSLEQLISPNRDKNSRAEVTVNYERAGARLALAYKTLRESRLLESVAEDIRNNYGLTTPVLITAMVCDEPNAFYDSQSSEIIVCYELLDDYFDMINAHIEASGGRD
ncbi:MAG TPA: hypothetical protein ENJ90_01855 [Devosia sp.]|nr:hypothetical protein [Devosia sp.]